MFFGRFGNGDTVSVKLATASAVGLWPSVVSLGLWHGCATSPDGVVHCWGRNHNGQLGDGTVEDQHRPVRVAADAPLGTVVTGDDFVCGLKPSGAAICWGGNGRGQLGIGTRGPLQCRFGNYCEPLPSPVEGGRQFKAIAAGIAHACAIGIDGAAFCWGQALDGELGATPGTRDRDDGRCSAHPLTVQGGLRFQTIAAGGLYTCGVTIDGRLYCWGVLHHGMNGDRPTFTPTEIAGAPRLTTMSASLDHTCGLTSLGEAYCFGANGQGQLGDGTQISARTPVRVSGGQLFKAIAAGAGFTCAISTTSEAYCWGSNMSGELGRSDGLRNCASPSDPSPQPCSLVPLPVPSPATASHD